MTADVSVRMVINATPEQVYAALVDWAGQSEWIPLTAVRVVEGDGGPGSVVEAVTGFGPARLVDVIRVDELEPPHRIRVTHIGRVLRGPGEFRCDRREDGRTDLSWHEWLELPGGKAGQLVWPMLRPGATGLLGWGLRRLARQFEMRAW